MPGFNHRAYAEAAISYAVRHKLNEDWDSLIRNLDIAFKHGEDTKEEVFDRVGIHMSKNLDFYNWAKSLDYITDSEKDELSCILGIATLYQIDDAWFEQNKVSSWLRGEDKEKFLDFISLEQMMFKMGV